jgi:cell division protein FtsL
MFIILIIAIVICIFVIAITVATTNKAYSVQHSVDPIPEDKKLLTNETKE